MSVIVALILTSAASAANLVVNGDFEGGYYVGQGYKCPNDWNWYPYPTGSQGRLYPGDDKGPGGTGDTCWRMRLVQNTTGKSVMYQVINTVPGRTYTVSAQWRLANANPDIGNPIVPWIGALFFDGGTPGDDDGNRVLIDAIVPNPTPDYPYRPRWPYTPPCEPLAEPILPPNQEIVAERAYGHGYDFHHQLDCWETIYDAAGGAGEPTMPGIGEPPENGGGAAWQTKVATGNHMIVGFFILDNPSETGSGSDLYVDNVSVTPEPGTLVLLALAMLPMFHRRRY